PHAGRARAQRGAVPPQCAGAPPPRRLRRALLPHALLAAVRGQPLGSRAPCRSRSALDPAPRPLPARQVQGLLQLVPRAAAAPIGPFRARRLRGRRVPRPLRPPPLRALRPAGALDPASGRARPAAPAPAPHQLRLRRPSRRLTPRATTKPTPQRSAGWSR